MPQNYFQQRKKSLLTKKDKSSIGGWDKKIIPLCNKINKLQQYYTTSSCSGRIVLMIDQTKKAKNLFLKQYHNKISFKQLKKELEKIIQKGSKFHEINKSASKASVIGEQKGGREKASEISKKIIKFKQEPMILHIACEDLKEANHLLKIAHKAGFKKTGIIALDKRIILEINASEKIEFPIINKKEILVSDEMLKLIIKKSNDNLGRNWDKIERLKRLI